MSSIFQEPVKRYLVLLPHPNDEHPDHRATSSFSRMEPTAGVSGAVLRARYLGCGGYSVESSTFTLALETVYFIER